MFAVLLQGWTMWIQAWSSPRTRMANHRNEMTRRSKTVAETEKIFTKFYPNMDEMANTSSRRQLFALIPSTIGLSLGLLVPPTSPALARNIPVSNGADTSKVGTVSALLPIIMLRTNLSSLRQSLKEQRSEKGDRPSDTIAKTKAALIFTKSGGNIERSSASATIPIMEADFKRIFDSYSDQVSYKQKFLDQNAFLVYYTNGYDGPGRDSLEKDPVNERQTLQFGTRNEAWISWDDFLAEWQYFSRSGSTSSDYTEDDFLDMIQYLSNTIQAVDRYLKLSPPEDLQAAEQEASK